MQFYQNAREGLDIYVPSGALGTYPVIFYIHGGAWVAGSKARAKSPCQNLAEKGYVCVVPAYTLSKATNTQKILAFYFSVLTLLSLAIVTTSMKQMGLIILFLLLTVSIFALLSMGTAGSQHQTDFQHPKHITDLANALKWTVENVAEYGGDPTQIHVMGYSAGAHLASLLSTNTSYTEMAEVPPGTVKSCVCVSGVYSDKRLAETPLGQQLLYTVFGQRKQYYDAFPIYNVSSQTPPFLLINGDIDLNLKRHSFDFHYCLRQSGVYSEMAYFPAHHWNILENPDMIEKVVTFLLNQAPEQI